MQWIQGRSNAYRVPDPKYLVENVIKNIYRLWNYNRIMTWFCKSKQHGKKTERHRPPGGGKLPTESKKQVGRGEGNFGTTMWTQSDMLLIKYVRIRFLKMLTDGADFISSGSKFHNLRSLKLNCVLSQFCSTIRNMKMMTWASIVIINGHIRYKMVVT